MPPRPTRKVKRVLARKPVRRRPKQMRKAPKMRLTRTSYKTPFPIKMNTQLVYKAPSSNISSGGILSYNACTFALNNMYDFDYNNILGNKQPLFYDQLLSSDGPYKNFKVNAWKTTIRFINLSDKALHLYYDPCVSLIVDADTPTEIENRRGVQMFLLTGANNSKPMITINKFQTLKSFFPNSINQSENFAGSYNSSPSTQAFSNMLWKTVDGSVASFSVAIQVQHIFYCTLYNADSIIS